MVTEAIGIQRDSLTVKEFMYRGDGFLGSFFGARPRTIALGFCGAAVLFLMLPAFIARVALIRDHSTDPASFVGFWQAWNWSLMYTVVFPGIFAGTSLLSIKCLKRFSELPGLNVVVKDDSTPGIGFVYSLAERVWAASRYLVVAIAVLTTVLIAADTKDIWTRLYRHVATGGAYEFHYLDWSVAFSLAPPRFDFYSFSKPGLALNLCFDGIAYLFEGTVVFLGLFWVCKYWIVLNCFSNLLISPHSGYNFKPKLKDPTRTLGLHGVGELFNWFLAIVVGFQLYVLGHRFQLIARSRDFATYVKEIIANPKDIPNLWAHTEFATCDVGMWSLLILGTLPIIVMAWVPLMKLHPYIKNIREQVYRSNLQAWEQAVEGSPEQKELKAAWKAAKEANIWPNGDFWGWLFLTLMIILAIAAFIPPALGYLVVGGGGMLLFRLIWQLRPKN